MIVLRAILWHFEGMSAGGVGDAVMVLTQKQDAVAAEVFAGHTADRVQGWANQEDDELIMCTISWKRLVST